MDNAPLKIVLTGGPGSGKTATSIALAQRHPDRIVRVPEAATQVYQQLRTRWDKLTVDGRRDVQRRIYRLQIEQEARIAADNPGKILLLDRGTIDGSAYWPDGPADYWRELGTDAPSQLRRYDAVIWLQTCAAVGLYDAEGSNPCRHEDADTAIAAGDMLIDLWAMHPKFFRVLAHGRLEAKIGEVERIVAKLAGM